MKTNNFFIGLILVILIVGGLMFLNIGFVKQSIYEGCTLIKPEFGRIECEPLRHTPIRSEIEMIKIVDCSSIPNFPGIGECYLYAFVCGDLENTPQCDYFVKTTSGARIFLFRTKKGETWSDWSEIELNEYQEKFVTSITAGTTIEFVSQKGLFEAGGKRILIESYIPYGLNAYDSGQKIRYNAKSCNIWDLPNAEKCAFGCDTTITKTALGNNIKSTGRLEFDDWVNWLSGYTYAPLDDNNKIVNHPIYGTVYCQINKLYVLKKIETIKTQNRGGCYYSVSDLLDYVECCPGMQSANSYCGDDFEWHPLHVDECVTDSDCVEKYGENYYCDQGTCSYKIECTSVLDCYGQGDWVPDYSTTEHDIVKYICKNNKCIIEEKKKVECTPPDLGCPSGYVCDPTRGYVCVKQEGPNILCGDGVCSRPYEDEINCPEDCEKPPVEIPFKFVILALIVLLSTLISYAKRKEPIWAVIGLVTGLIVAIILYLLIEFVLAHWIEIAIGTALFGLTGGIIIYLLGGGAFILALIALLMKR